MAIILTYVGLSVALIYHLLTDFHKHKVGHPIRHWLGALCVVTISAIIGVLNQVVSPEYQWWQFVIYSLSIHLALFDPIWNLLNKNPWYYAGDPNNPNGAWTDKFWQRVPPLAQILFRAWFLIMGAEVYYNLDRILGQ